MADKTPYDSASSFLALFSFLARFLNSVHAHEYATHKLKAYIL